MTYKNKIIVCSFLLLSNILINKMMASSHNINKNDTSSTEWIVPFKLVKNLIVVEAFVNGKKGNFIVNTGTEFMILNSKYFTAEIDSELQAIDFGGNDSGMGEIMIDFNWQSRKVKSFYSLVTDLSNLEKIMHLKIMGYIGYELLKRNEIVFDYQNNNLTFFDLDKKGKRKNPSLNHSAPSEIISLQKNGFLPYLTVSIGMKQFRFGIDSGVSLNLLSEDKVKDLGSNFQAGNAIKAAGFNGKVILVKSGILNEIDVQDFKWSSMKCVVKDLGYLNKNLHAKIDGLLGFEFLNQYKISINYQKNQMSVWNPDFSMTDNDLIVKVVD